MKGETIMTDFSVNEMLEMQKALHEKYKDQWEPISAKAGRSHLLWMIGEAGEVIDIIKKHGDEEAAADAELRKDLVEELADVLMHYTDILLCYSISAGELKQAFSGKLEKNMKRW